MELNDIQKKFDSWFGSDACAEYFKLEEFKNNIFIKRCDKFENYIKTHNFDEFLNKIIYQHDKKYRDKCYTLGFQPKPNNIMDFIFDYVSSNYETIIVDQINNCFNNEVWFYRGYYFQIIHGQGSCYSIYDYKFKLIFSI